MVDPNDLIAYCKKRKEELLGDRRYRAGYHTLHTAWEGSSLGIAGNPLRKKYKKVKGQPSRYVKPGAKRGRMIKKALVGVEDAIYEEYERYGFRLSDSGVSGIIQSIVRRGIENKGYGKQVAERIVERKVLEDEFRLRIEEVERWETNVVCGADKNPIASYKALVAKYSE